MTRLISDLESIIEPISILFGRARVTGNLVVPAPSSMLFSEENNITLVWNLSDLPAEEAVSSFDQIRSLATTEFSSICHDDVGIVTYTGEINWHGDYPDVFFRVVISKEAAECQDSTGNQSVSS